MKWNNSYDKIIAQCILQYGFNLPVAFFEAQKILESKYSETVSRKAITARYYRRREYIHSVIDNLIDEIEEEVAITRSKEIRKPWYVKLWKAVLSMLNLNQKI